MGLHHSIQVASCPSIHMKSFFCGKYGFDGHLRYRECIVRPFSFDFPLWCELSTALLPFTATVTPGWLLSSWCFHWFLSRYRPGFGLMSVTVVLHRHVMFNEHVTCVRLQIWIGMLVRVSFYMHHRYMGAHIIFDWHSALYNRGRKFVRTFLRRTGSLSVCVATTLTPGIALLCSFLSIDFSLCMYVVEKQFSTDCFSFFNNVNVLLNKAHTSNQKFKLSCIQ